MLVRWADHILLMETVARGETVNRKLRTIPTHTRDAGSRGNIVPDGFELNGDASANWKKFRALFD